MCIYCYWAFLNIIFKPYRNTHSFSLNSLKIIFYLLYLYCNIKPPSIKCCVQKSNFANFCFVFTSKKVFKIFVYPFRVCIQKKVHETEQVVQGASGQAKIYLCFDFYSI